MPDWTRTPLPQDRARLIGACYCHVSRTCHLQAIWNFDAYKDETDVCESICRFSESFCEHKGWLTGCNEDRRRKLQVEKANKKASHDEWGNAINWNVYLDPWDPDNEDKN